MVLSVLYFGRVVSIIVGSLLVNIDDGVAVTRLFAYPAHIASVTCQLLVCFCRNRENDTLLHLLNTPLYCANFTFLS
jgi:hypothetical protein